MVFLISTFKIVLNTYFFSTISENTVTWSPCNQCSMKSPKHTYANMHLVFFVIVIFFNVGLNNSAPPKYTTKVHVI